jgi:hypothetical protein
MTHFSGFAGRIIVLSLAAAASAALGQQTAAPAPVAPKAVMRDGHPAMECTSSDGKTWSAQ